MPYDELVRRLREAPNDWPDADLHYEAADAIEELATNYDASTDIMKHQTEYIEELERERDSANEAATALYGALPKWIPVEEQLPPVDEDVLIVAYGSMMRIWNIHRLDPKTADVCWEREDGTMDDMCVVTHWMPLPQPPEEE